MHPKHKVRYAFVPVMRALLYALLLLLAFGVAVTLYWNAGGEASKPPGMGSDMDLIGGPGRGEASGGQRLPEGVVATRSVPDRIHLEPLADQPTVCLRILDYRTQQPVFGAVVRSLQTGADLGFSDEQGLARVPLKKPAQLAVVLDQYLLRMVPAQLGSTEEEPQSVSLVPDQWSLTRRFAFVDSQGQPVDDVFVRLRPATNTPLVSIVMPADDAVVRRAWSEHTMLATRIVSRDVAVQLGKYSVDRVHRFEKSDARIRFVAPGDYFLEAASARGLVAYQELVVMPGSEPPRERVVMRAGAYISGRVTDLSGAPLATAEITVQGSDPLGLRATTASDGRFRIGPLGNLPVTLLARHGLHEPIAYGPIAVSSGATAESVFIKLRALDRVLMRGRVRARPSLKPITAATVIWQVQGGAAISVQTDENGVFHLLTAGDSAANLMVQAPGYVTYRELVDPGAAFAEYDVWPADRATRVAAGITATLEGVVFASDGSPIESAPVRWIPASPTTSQGLPGRRVLSGASLSLPGVATTDSSGAFVLETNQFGLGKLILTSNVATSVSATAIAGQSKQGIELRQ
jgi:hypothetical protein